MLDVIVTAGYSPDEPDPLAQAEGVSQKALIDVAGHPLVWWTVRTLRETPGIGHIVVVGIDPALDIDFGEDVWCLPNDADHLGNVMNGANHILSLNPESSQGLIVSGDIPFLRTETVRWLMETGLSQDYDFYYTVVQDTVMETQFPGARRSYVRMKEGRFCGGDMFFFRMAALQGNLPLAQRLMAERKHALRQAMHFGIVPLLKLVLGRLSIPEGERIAQRLLQCRVKVLISPYADLAMDVDKPHQLEMARRVLANRPEARSG